MNMQFRAGAEPAADVSESIYQAVDSALAELAAVGLSSSPWAR